MVLILNIRFASACIRTLIKTIFPDLCILLSKILPSHTSTSNQNFKGQPRDLLGTFISDQVKVPSCFQRRLADCEYVTKTSKLTFLQS